MSVTDAAAVAIEMIGESPTRATVNGIEMDVFWGPSEIMDGEEGSDMEAAQVVCISNTEPVSPIGKNGVAWSILSLTGYSDVYEIQAVKE